MSRVIPRLVALLVVIGVAIQFAGPGRPAFVRDDARELQRHATVPPDVDATLRRACYDCHSDEVRWPWYSRVAPVSWLVNHDVTEGRGQLNFSRWSEYNPYDRADMLDAACDLARKRAMPLRPYVVMHRTAHLSDDDITRLCAWTATEAARLTNE